jgi:hypothetical protein
MVSENNLDSDGIPGPFCPECDYSLHGLPGHVCPECGTRSTDVDVPPAPEVWCRRLMSAIEAHPRLKFAIIALFLFAMSVVEIKFGNRNAAY